MVRQLVSFLALYGERVFHKANAGMLQKVKHCYVGIRLIKYDLEIVPIGD